ncbi:ComEA family DNA-binding protein [Nonomuraea terrae]|uniref:ComEA family DNA-binding protein n=1 Tax=Nonomuraea terrae TaxID=2530383 RepID=UPI001FE7044F|nr:ComEA family DNA-binding protein [Nonomuraea terrae]
MSSALGHRDSLGSFGPAPFDLDHPGYLRPVAIHNDDLGPFDTSPHAWSGVGSSVSSVPPDPVTASSPAVVTQPKKSPAAAPQANKGPAAAQTMKGFTTVPPSLQRFRTALASQGPTLDPGRPGLRVLLAIGVLAAAVAAFLVWQAQPRPQPLPPPTPIVPATPSPTAKVTVHVAGKIRKPGVYLLPSGARVTDAIAAAGGVSRGASIGGLNLARRLIDGEQIVVGAKQQPAAPGSPVVDPASTVLDLNSATAEQLEQLPGVGEVLAARIVEFRTSRGGFTAVDQLREVSGIGPKTFEEIKPKVRI